MAIHPNVLAWKIQWIEEPGIITDFNSPCSCLLKCVKSLQLCPTLCNSMDGSPPGFSVHGIIQARILEWVAVPFSRGHPDPGIEPGSPALQEDSLPSELSGMTSKTWGL